MGHFKMQHQPDSDLDIIVNGTLYLLVFRLHSVGISGISRYDLVCIYFYCFCVKIISLSILFFYFLFHDLSGQTINQLCSIRKEAVGSYLETSCYQ